jgi:GlpG protein
MRLIGSLKEEKEAFQLISFFQKEGIAARYEPGKDQSFLIWVECEDDLENAIHWFEEFRKDTGDPRFDAKKHPIDTQGIAENKEEPLPKRVLRLRGSLHPRMPLTRLIVLICALLYLWNTYQMQTLRQENQKPEFYTLTPLMTELAYDIPTAANREELSRELFAENRVGDDAVWDGFYGVALGWPQSKRELNAPLFVQLRQGEVWRFVTPIFLHGSFFHILFNMLWLWMLGRQVEERVKKWQYLVVTLIIAIVSNTFQYLMSGPLFIGYSGVICGLAGFIWMRQRCAPWEGYPLQKGTIIFLGVFVVGMMVLQLVSFFLIRFQLAQFSMNIANTAHITGALTGIVLGRIPFFSKGAL